jgi:uncharacterized damage-inducible protein DinB
MNADTLLTFHQRTLDAVEAVLHGLEDRDLRREEPDSCKTIAGEIAHIFEAEGFWLLKLGLPAPQPPPEERPTVEQLGQALAALDEHMTSLVERHASNADLRGILMHVTLHALYHLPHLIRIRQSFQSEWVPPRWDAPGSFERAVGPMVRYAVEHME